jgi:hypothetical protein
MDEMGQTVRLAQRALLVAGSSPETAKMDSLVSRVVAAVGVAVVALWGGSPIMYSASP